MNGTIFDIKEFSIHDGPGGRVTVFLKGCSLRCIWCHNPEGLEKEPQLMCKNNLCTHCGACRRPCGHAECKPFSRCVHACPNGCLSISGKTVSAEKLAAGLRSYESVLKSLGGGITVSGGEPMMQADFVCELADRLKGMHKAIQTSGCTSAEAYKTVIERFDYIMQDIKLVNRELHKKYTGVYNDTILENIEYLKRSGKEFVLRVPMIPGITDTKDNLAAISEIAEGCNIEYLPYNTLAGAKYEMLGMKYKLRTEGNNE